MSVTKENYREFYDDAKRVENILACERETEADGWKSIGERDGCVMFSKATEDSPFLLFKGCVTMEDCKFSVAQLTQWLRNMDNFPKADAMAYNNECVETFDENHQMNYACFKTPPLVWDRDFVWLESHHVLDDGRAHAILGESHPDERKPPSGKHERGHINTSGYLLRDVGEGKIKVFYIAQADPKGWLPVWVTNIVSKDQAYNPGRVRDFFKAHPDEIAAEEEKKE